MYTENENALWGQQRTLSSGVTIAIGSPGNAGGPMAQNGKGGPK